jgi:hypothetical protein
MRLGGKLVMWNDERCDGRNESTRGAALMFVHVSAWRRGGARRQLRPSVTRPQHSLALRGLLPMAVELKR